MSEQEKNALDQSKRTLLKAVAGGAAFAVPLMLSFSNTAIATHKDGAEHGGGKKKCRKKCGGGKKK